jgi:hypothetical protein
METQNAYYRSCAKQWIWSVRVSYMNVERRKMEQSFPPRHHIRLSVDLGVMVQAYTMNASQPSNSTEDLDLEEFSLNLFQLIVHTNCIFWGGLINGFVAFVMFTSGRLYNPRNRTWFGLIICNLLTLSMGLTECIVVHWPNQIICYMFSALVGIPYTLLLFNVLLAVGDRCLALMVPVFYRTKVTVRHVNTIQIVLFTLIPTLLMLPYWSNLVPLQCGFNRVVGKLFGILASLLVLLCVSAQLVLYREARKYLGGSVSDSSLPLSDLTPTQREPVTETSDSLGASYLRGPRFFAYCGSKRISKLDLEAALSVLSGITSLCIFTLPMAGVFFYGWICPKVTDHCNLTRQAGSIAREFLLVHAVYNPIVYAVRSREFHSALRRSERVL